MRAIICLCLVVLATAPARADERIRQAQEELRKRNLYFGNVDGRESPELSGALKRYQARKGFSVTGRVEDETAASLHIQTTTASAASLPDLPVLRSDAARELPPAQRAALQEVEDFDTAPTPAAPAEAPSLGQDLTPERVTKFVQDYLRDAETDDLPAQIKYFTYPIEYFDHGLVDEKFVLRDVRNYLKRWPQRKYTLNQPVSFFAGGREGETTVEFLIAYDVRNQNRTASGRTKNWWTLQAEGNDLKIVSMREQRLRE